MALKTPRWRHGSAYSRPLTDPDGLITGREVCVFSRKEDVLLVEGQLGARTFEKAWYYKVLAEAVRAAEEWDGIKSPNGDWFDYKCRDNGDQVEIPDESPGVPAEYFEILGTGEKFPIEYPDEGPKWKPIRWDSSSYASTIYGQPGASATVMPVGSAHVSGSNANWKNILSTIKFTNPASKIK